MPFKIGPLICHCRGNHLRCQSVTTFVTSGGLDPGPYGGLSGTLVGQEILPERWELMGVAAPCEVSFFLTCRF